MKRLARWVGIFGLVLGVTACASSARANPPVPQAVAGVVDLRAWDLAQNGVVYLNGEWEFYWEQLLTPVAVAAGANVAPPPRTGWIGVPGVWHDFQVNGHALGSDGYATYRLTLLLPPSARAEKLLALKMPVPINTAHRLYVNGQWLGAAGQVGATAEAMTPQHYPYTAFFAPVDERVEILLQISSFHQQSGGIIQPLAFGTQTQIQQLNEDEWARDFFLVGSIFIIGLYHLMLFLLRRQDRAPLYFGFFCMLVVGVTLLLDQPQLFAAHLSPQWDIYVRTLVVTVSCWLVSQTLFFQAVFQSEALPWAPPVSFGGMLLLCSLALFVPNQAVATLQWPVIVYLLGSHLYALGVVLRAVARQRTDAGVSLLGYLPLLLAALNDAVVASQRTTAEPLLPVGLFVFILVQAYLLSARFARAFTQTERLTEALRQSEAKYRTLFEESKDLIFMTALDGQVVGVNPAFFQVLGYTREEALRLNAAHFYAHPEERRRFQTAIAQAGAVADFPVRLRHKAGHELDCQLTATLRHDPTGQSIGYQGIVHDLTAYKQVEAHQQRVLALQDLNQSLEQRIEARTEALTEANTALQMEIEQRQSQQQEKERLLALAQQQSEHLRAMSAWLLEMPNGPQSGQATKLDEGLRQKIAEMRQNLSLLQRLEGFEQDFSLVTYVSDMIRLLAEVEIYVEQVTATLEEASPTEAMLAGDHPLLQLSSRERQVLKLVAEGKSNPEIAALLTVRLNTVHTYLKRIRTKLDIQSTAGLTNFARDHGLLR